WSFTRGALTAIVPEPMVTFRVRPLPLRTTRGVAGGVAVGGVGLQGDLRLQGREEHAARPLAGDPVEQRAPIDLFIPRLAPSRGQHGGRLPAAACAGAAIAQAGGYAAGVTGSTIHNFRSYLRPHRGSRPTRSQVERRIAASMKRSGTLVAGCPGSH